MRESSGRGRRTVVLLAALALAPPGAALRGQPAGGGEDAGVTDRPGAALVAERPPRDATVQEARGQEAIIQVVQALFDAMAERDTATIRSLMLETSPALAVLARGDSVTWRWSGVEDFLRAIGGEGPRLLERMWEPVVRIDGPLATLRAPYDFHRGDRFSHCGVDVFQLVRTPDGWKIAEVAYTMVPEEEACPPSPLGPPEP